MLKIITVAFMLGSVAVFSAAQPALAEENLMQRTLSLSGHGEVRAAPDLVSLSLGVFTNADSATAALTANNTAMQAVLSALKSAGVDERDTQTSNLTVNPRYDTRSDSSGQPQTAGFDASNNVNIVVRKVDQLGRILDAAVGAGANQVNSLTFGIENDQQLLDEARKLAVAEARRKAELYAAASGVVLGNIVTISEGGSYQPGPQQFKARAEAADASVPIAQGEQVLAIDVSVTWEIK